MTQWRKMAARIETDEQHAEALERISQLMEKQNLTTIETVELMALSQFADEYESQRWPIGEK
jgi:antitoxin component HigA of HigAB toxin-antitoxin module